MKKAIKLAYSPDTDDAFMVHAIKEKLVDLRGYQFELTSLDIQQLNRAALASAYDISAISMAAYPAIAHNYYLMPVGSSIGDQFGPAVVVKNASPISSIAMLEGKRIAVPGALTSAFFAARSIFPKFEAIQMSFSDIEGAVAEGTVDAGILIHEPQLLQDHPYLRKIGDLGALWHEKFALPLPLGGNAIKRSLGAEVVQELTQIYRDSIKFAFAHRSETLSKASASAICGLPLDVAEKYIDQYVNHRSLDIDPDVQQGLDVLFELGWKAGLCPKLVCTEIIC